MRNSRTEIKRKQEKRYYFVSIMTALLLLITFNIFCATVTKKAGLRLDMTDEDLYTLSDQTVEIIDEIKNEISIEVISSKEEFLPIVVETLDRYVQKANGKIVLRYIDPYENPEQIDAYLQKGLPVSIGSVIVRGTGGIQVIDTEDLFVLDSKKNAVKEITAERALSSALLKVESDEKHKAVFSAGHNEKISEELNELLLQNYFDTETINLSLSDIETDVELFIIASPTADFSVEEIEKLDGYLSTGGDILFFAAPMKYRLTRLYDFFEEWGIQIGIDQVSEEKQYIMQEQGNIVPIYGKHDITKYFADNQLMIVMPLTVALEQKYTKQGDIKTKKVLYSTGEAYMSEEDSKEAPYTLAMTAEKNVEDEKARILAFGSVGMYDSNLMKSDTYGNAKFLAQGISWCTDTGELLAIPSKVIGSKPIFVTRQHIRLFCIICIGLCPMMFLITGFFVYRRRRHS